MMLQQSGIFTWMSWCCRSALLMVTFAPCLAKKNVCVQIDRLSCTWTRPTVCTRWAQPILLNTCMSIPHQALITPYSGHLTDQEETFNRCSCKSLLDIPDILVLKSSVLLLRRSSYLRVSVEHLIGTGILKHWVFTSNSTSCHQNEFRPRQEDMGFSGRSQSNEFEQISCCYILVI